MHLVFGYTNIKLNLLNKFEINNLIIIEINKHETSCVVGVVIFYKTCKCMVPLSGIVADNGTECDG
jgi:hypothetical protein